MKIIQLAFSIILASTLSGCAYNGYQRGYSGYSSGYGSGYSTSYGVQRSYYPAQTYYPQGGVIRHQQQYASPRYSNHDVMYGRDRPHDNRDWQAPRFTHGHQQSGSRDHDASRWQDHSSRQDGRQQNHNLERKRENQVQRRQDASAPNRSRQSDSSLSRARNTQRDFNNHVDGNSSREHRPHGKRER